MSLDELVKKAIDVIGSNEIDDYIINPTGHASRYKNKAEELVNILNSEEIRDIAVDYEKKDTKAINMKNHFRKLLIRAHIFALLAVFFSAALATSSAWSNILGTQNVMSNQSLAWILTGLSIFFSFSTGLTIRSIKYHKRLENWMITRAEAEEKRLLYFYKIAELYKKVELSTSGKLHIFEYFRRFQLDVQMSFYLVKGSEHKKSSQFYFSLSAIALFFVLILNAFSGFLGAEKGLEYTSLAMLALFAQTAATLIMNIEAVDQDRRNAERYGRTYEALELLQARLDPAREQIVSGNSEILTKFIEAVHEPLSTEHRQWRVAFNERYSAIGRLEEQLNYTRTFPQS
jgi:hypothetical protein